MYQALPVLSRNFRRSNDRARGEPRDTRLLIFHSSMKVYVSFKLSFRRLEQFMQLCLMFLQLRLLLVDVCAQNRAYAYGWQKKVETLMDEVPMYFKKGPKIRMAKKVLYAGLGRQSLPRVYFGNELSISWCFFTFL